MAWYWALGAYHPNLLLPAWRCWRKYWSGDWPLQWGAKAKPEPCSVVFHQLQNGPMQPTLTLGNTNTSTILLAKKDADLVLVVSRSATA